MDIYDTNNWTISYRDKGFSISEINDNTIIYENNDFGAPKLSIYVNNDYISSFTVFKPYTENEYLIKCENAKQVYIYDKNFNQLAQFTSSCEIILKANQNYYFLVGEKEDINKSQKINIGINAVEISQIDGTKEAVTNSRGWAYFFVDIEHEGIRQFFCNNDYIIYNYEMNLIAQKEEYIKLTTGRYYIRVESSANTVVTLGLYFDSIDVYADDNPIIISNDKATLFRFTPKSNDIYTISISSNPNWDIQYKISIFTWENQELELIGEETSKNYASIEIELVAGVEYYIKVDITNLKNGSAFFRIFSSDYSASKNSQIIYEERHIDYLARLGETFTFIFTPKTAQMYRLYIDFGDVNDKYDFAVCDEQGNIIEPISIDQKDDICIFNYELIKGNTYYINITPIYLTSGAIESEIEILIKPYEILRLRFKIGSEIITAPGNSIYVTPGTELIFYFINEKNIEIINGLKISIETWGSGVIIERNKLIFIEEYDPTIDIYVSIRYYFEQYSFSVYIKFLENQNRLSLNSLF